MNTKKRIRTCKCGKAFETLGDRKCDDCRAAQTAANPACKCKTCGKIDRYCRRGICPECREATRARRVAAWEAPVENRRRTLAEQYVELYMTKHSHASDDLTPRQHLALDRKLTATYKRVADDWFEEFKCLVFVLAIKQGKLAPDRWNWFRCHRTNTYVYRAAVATLHHEVWGSPRHWTPSEHNINANFVGRVLPKLRAQLANSTVESEAPQDATDEVTDAKWADLAKWVAQSPMETQFTVLKMMFGFIARNEEEIANTENTFNPEEIPADNQDAIDAAFGELMDGVL